jgi:NitT/TauT family transport system ATP-binding protein
MIMTAQPGRVKTLVPVALPRPRNVLELQREPEFGSLVHHIWSDLRDEVQRSRQQDEERAKT